MRPETRLKWQRLRRDRRGFVSLAIFASAVALSLFSELIANPRPYIASYGGELRFPMLREYPETAFGGDFETEVNFADPTVRARLKTGGNWAIFPPIAWDYKTINFDPALQHPSPPSRTNWLGTDDRGRDVAARLLYGFRLSILFGLILATIASVVGVVIGAIQGYFGGWLDLLGQRAIEIWGSLPELYLLIILSASIGPSIPVLIVLLSIFGWMGVAAYVRADFLRARNLDYVRAARALGVNRGTIMLKHIVPNTLTSVVTFFPFRVSGAIAGLAALDFLNLGVPSPAPSLGELLGQAKGNVEAWWLSISAVMVLIVMMVLISFIGEAVLKAFDPRRSN